MYLLCFFLMIGVAYGQEEITVKVEKQLSKAETKRWKKIAKGFFKNPRGLKLIMKEHEAYKAGYSSIVQEVKKLRRVSAQADGKGEAEVQALETEIRSLNRQLLDAKNALSSMEEQKQELDDNYGIWYRVQIGAFQQEELEANLETTADMTVEKGGDNLQRIVLGRYRSYDQAQVMRNQLMKMGVRGAWVVSYKNGQRISIKEALNDF